jgi:hypothetical protein
MEAILYCLSEVTFGFLFFMLLLRLTVSVSPYPLKIISWISLSLGAATGLLGSVSYIYKYPAIDDIFVIEAILLVIVFIMLTLNKYIFKSESFLFIITGIMFVVGILICNDIFNSLYREMCIQGIT